MIQSYKQNPTLAEDYDCLIIGSGMSGLTVGALLAKEGKRVLILERHYTAGGFTHVFKRPGYEWDVGIHYVGEMGRTNSFSRKMSDYISDKALGWADIGEVYDRIVIGERVYDFPKGVKNLKANLKEYFPDDGAAIDQYFDLVFAATKANQKYFIDKALPEPLRKLFGRFLRKGMYQYSRKTTLEVLSKLTGNQELIKVLTAQFGDYGLPPAESSFAMHAVLVRHYFNGGYFPIGGSSKIAETVDHVIQNAGGTILINADVEEIIVEDTTAIGVRLVDGKIFHAKSIVSSAGVHLTMNKLLPQSLKYTQQLIEGVKGVRPSSAHVCLYVGLKGTPEELKLPKANYWIYPAEGTHDENIKRFADNLEAELPLVYISFPAAKDPTWNKRYSGKSTIDILTVMPYVVFDKWEGTTWKKRPDDYEELKEKLAQRLLDKLYEREPQTRGKVDFYELSSPLTTKKFVNYEKGEIYGLEHSPDRFDRTILRPRTGIKNFYLTGQDISTAGVVGAMAAGLLTASAIAGKNLMKKVLKS